ncbi:MAG TPA: diguanylate cyclase, partial [Actinotalea sp.]|nr:diguanylate cyclase [Actinotalea sp.]
RDHAIRPLRLADEQTPARVRANSLLRRPDALALNESTENARRRYREAEQVFVELGDRERRLNVLNNLTVLEYESGDVAAALSTAERLFAMSTPEELNPACADSIARARLHGGDLDRAEQVARLGLDLWRSTGDVQASTPVELGLTLAEVLLARGRVAEAEKEVAWCLDLCRDRSLGGMRVDALRVRAEVLAAWGRYEDAYRVHREFHESWVAVRSSQQVAATRTRQALFEAEEARRDADRFREQAHTDALTGLANRRRVNAELPVMLRRGAANGVPVATAIVDLDHFKAVNDTFSHQIGDEVLRRVAAMLAATAADGELAARLGGEEFLLVLHADAVARVERLRAAVAAHPWDELAAGLAVTVSAGVSVLRGDDEQAGLLARADRLLY